MACTEDDSRSQVVDNLPRYGGQARESTAVQHRSRFACLSPQNAGHIIYYLTRGVPGDQITRYFGYHSRGHLKAADLAEVAQRPTPLL